MELQVADLQAQCTVVTLGIKLEQESLAQGERRQEGAAALRQLRASHLPCGVELTQEILPRETKD